MSIMTWAAAELRRLAARILQAAGAPESAAGVVAEALVEANLVGHDSHGVIRVPEYVAMIRAGSLQPLARPRVVRHRAATVLVSGEWGFGQVTGQFAVQQAVSSARAMGCAAVGILRGNHMGRVGRFVEQAALEDCAAVMWVGGLEGPQQMVPYGGTRAAMGTNPIAAGFPLQGESPLMLDFATTAVAGGKVMVAHARGHKLPPGCIVDRDGRPSTEPRDFLDGGALLPFGGHKGYCLAVLGELLAQSLTGSDETGEEGGGSSAFSRSGALILAVHIGAFRDPHDVKARARDVADRLRAIPPAPGFTQVFTPGEIEQRTGRQRQEAGIELPAQTWGALMDCAEELGVADVRPPVDG